MSSSISRELASNADLSYVHHTAANWLELNGDIEVAKRPIAGTHNGLSVMDDPLEPVAYSFYIEGGDLMDLVCPNSSRVLHGDTAGFTYTPAYYHLGDGAVEYHGPLTRFTFDAYKGGPGDIASQLIDITAVPNIRLVETSRIRSYFKDSPEAREERRQNPAENAMTREEALALRGVVRNLKTIKKIQQQRTGRVRTRYIGG